MTNISADLFRNIVEAMPDGLWVADQQHRIIYANAAMAAISGLPIEQIVGRTVREAFPVQEEGCFHDHYLAAAESLQPQQFTCQVVTPGERPRWRGGWLTPMLEGGELSGMLCTVQDITSHKQAESHLQESEARFRAIFENDDTLAIQGYAPDGTVIYWNRASEKIYGYTASEAVGSSLYDLIIPPEATAAVRDEVAWMFDNRKSVPAARFDLLHKDGHAVPVFSSHAVVTTQDHGAILFCLDVDLNELETTQRALHDSQQMLHHLADQLPGAIYQFRRFPDGRISIPYASDGFYDMYEVTPDEVREDAAAVRARWHPDDAEGVCRAIAASAQTLQPLITEFRVNLPGQGVKWRWSQASPEEKADGSVLWHGYVSDITAKREAEAALRESEAKFRQKSQSLADVIWGTKSGTWEWNILTGETVVNDYWAEIVGYTLEELSPVTADTWRQMTHPDDLAEKIRRLQRCFSSETDIFEYESRMRHKNGEWVWVRDRGRVVEWTAGGNPLRMSGTRKDVTEHKLAEDELIAAKAKAEQASNAKSRFLAATSHDLRQPLAALSLYVDVLKSKVAAPERPLLNNMANCVSSLGELLTDLLDLSKLDAGVIIPEVSDFSVAELLANLQAVHAPEASLKGLSLRCVSSGLKASTDAVLFRRLLGNLIANAVRYTGQGGAVVGCRRRQGKTWIEVWDTGIGIPADKTDEIFEEFRQLDHDERNRGSGLGLAIVAKSAALLGLQIRVQSKPGKGSMFAVELPLGKKAATVGLFEARERPLSIALVDDNVSVLDAVVCALEMMGHQVVAATAGQELLARLGSQSPDIVICDFSLAGGETGFDVITAVRAAFGAMLPALLITGDSDPQLTRSMADRGIVVQHKPVEFDALQACIAQMAGLR